ncbi:MAG: FAD-binding protein [Nitrospirae bacterium]|nr:FAD-binding protein [Nitrospirota bacterium]
MERCATLFLVIPPHVIKSLQESIGKDSVITDRESLLCYSYDATRREAVPDLLLRPGNAEEVSAILRIANREKIVVVPRGAGSGFVGGSVPVQGGMVLSLQRMDRILEVNRDDFYIVVEPGVVTREVQKAAEAEGLFYPPDPSSVNFCTIGGNIATGAGGARGIKYGTTKDYVMGLDVVLPSGDMISIGTRAPRSVAGYDLTRLMVGSEGTLGVITKAILRLIPLPEKIVTLAAVFPGLYNATATVGHILRSSIRPLVLEFMDRESIRVVREMLPINVREKGEAMLIVELDGTPGVVERDLQKVEEICKRSGAIDVELATTSADRERLWTARRSVSPSLYKINPTKINEDVVVPRSRLSDLIGEIEKIAAQYRLQIVSFGHAGAGNLHINIMTDDKNAEEYGRAQEAVKALFEATLRLGGSISGEHGIGITKARFLPMEVGEQGIAIMKEIKRAFDPNQILNPGKLWP